MNSGYNESSFNTFKTLWALCRGVGDDDEPTR
jgi:hypothetical protein